MGGQLWRFDITNGNDRAQLAAGGVVAQFGGDGMTTTPAAGDTRRFYNSPDVAMFNAKKMGKNRVVLYKENMTRG